MVLKCDTTRLLSGRMSRLINFLGNFIIVVVLLHSASLSLPSKKFFLDALFLFSLSLSSIILHILFPNFPFWFPPKGIKGIQVVFELFQFQSLRQPSVFDSTEIEVVLSRREGEKKKKKQKTIHRKQRWSTISLVRWSRRGGKKVEKFSNLFQSCWTRDTIDGKAIWRSVGSRERRKDRLAERRWTLEARGTVFASCPHYHTYCVAIANQASSAARFSHFHEETRSHSRSQRGVDLWKDWIKSSATKDREASEDRGWN